MGTNRLAEATSPYLLQHAHNPVDWYPWGSDALERARREGKPIFLSIGYAACHWCHVMEREVFEKPAIAALMNEHFVNIKVDREERPDLDDLYMMATQIMSGSGGWPMSVWLTPELEPFYAGTYFPPEDAYGRPGFVRLEKALAEAWGARREALREQAAKVVEAVRMHADEGSGGQAGPAEIDLGTWLSTAIEQYADRFDGVNGGLGGAPKFPPHQALGLWLEMLERAEALELSHTNREMLRNMVVRTLDGMMRGGIYDHVGGGFARYSTDERWLVPHFEKMLYDSAQLAPVYARAAVMLGRADYRRVARETLDFWRREMMDERGGFYSSLDADSEGAEGKFYVWTLGDVREALGNADAAVVIDYFGLTEDGNWAESPMEGASVLAPVLTVEALAQKYEMPPEKMWERLSGPLERLRVSRAGRPGPGLDDKVLTGWNGLMVSALAVCGRMLGDPRYVDAAARTAEFLWREHRKDGRLLRVSRHGAAHTEAFLDDHAYLLAGLVDLSEALLTAEAGIWEARARELATTLVGDFGDGERGGFFFTGPRHEKLFARMKNAADNATPSGNGVAIRALLRLAQRTGEGRWEEAALGAVRAFAANITRRPEYFATILQGLLERAEGGATGSPAEREGSAVLSVAAEASAVGADRTFEVVVRLTIAAGYHVQGHEPADRQLHGTVARLRSTVELAAEAWKYPPARPVEGGEGYAGLVELQARCRLAEGVGAGRHVMRAIVEAQPCTATACLAAQTLAAEFVVEVP